MARSAVLVAVLVVGGGIGAASSTPRPAPCMLSGTADGIVASAGPRWFELSRTIQWTPTPHAANGEFRLRVDAHTRVGPTPTVLAPGENVTVSASCVTGGSHADHVLVLDPD